MKALAACITLIAGLWPLAAFSQGSDGHAMGAASEAAPFGSPVDDEHIWYHALLDQFEGRAGARQAFHWEGEAWAGTDTNRVWFKSEGSVNDRSRLESGRYELLYSRPITSFFDLQGGARLDAGDHAGRGWLALGVEGLAPLFLHVSATGYASSEGHLAARLEGSYDLLLTQRLILQPRIEVNLYSKDDPARAIGAGLSDMDTGLRLRYEITRKFAPYIGLSYEQAFGGTAALARRGGDTASALRFAFGVRAWL